MEFSRKEYCSGLPFSSPEHLPDPGIKRVLQGYKQILYHLNYKEILKESTFEGFSGTLWSVHCSAMSHSLRPGTAACQASLSNTNSQSLLKLMSIRLVMPSNHLICHPLLLLQSFPTSGSFPMSQFFVSGSQSIETSPSASVLPMNIQDWFSLGWTGWSPCSPGDFQESSPTPQFKGINSLVLSFLYGPTVISIHDYWKNHSFGKMDLCWQSNVSAF